MKNYRYILKMTHKMNKWEQLILLSEISRSPSLALEIEIQKAFQNWLDKLNKFFIDPTAEQLEIINHLSNSEKRLWNSDLKRAINQRITILTKKN